MRKSFFTTEPVRSLRRFEIIERGLKDNRLKYYFVGIFYHFLSYLSLVYFKPLSMISYLLIDLTGSVVNPFSRYNMSAASAASSDLSVFSKKRWP